MHRPSLDDVAGDTYDLQSDESECGDASETDFLIDAPPATPTHPASKWPLFSLLSRRQLPAIVSSLFAGAIAPFMSIVIGHAFDAFSKFSATPAQNLLLERVGTAALQLLGLAIGSFTLSGLTSFLWITTGEHNVMTLRKRVYASVAAKDMVWFDTKASADAPSEGDNGPVGAGGLMAQFTKDTNEIRSAALATGRTVEYLTTFITCLILAFSRSPTLTLVILLAVPILVIIQFASQSIAGPLLGTERQQTAVAATLVDRAVTATGISTVKAFNAAAHEERTLGAVLARIEGAVWKLVAVWGITSGLAQFVMMGMFVQGFWFGAHVVRSGSIGAGDVMAVFWACLMATTNLQLCIPQFMLLAKGKHALASLLEVIDAHDATYPPKTTTTPCREDIMLRGVAFAYPARPAVPVLRDVTLHLPAHATTFVVGPSGSGKSTIAHLLAGLYAPQQGAVLVDDGAVPLRALDVAAVGQGAACVLFDMSIHDNVALGRRSGSATRAEVQAVCEQVLMHEFISGLPAGYDTMLGSGGASLSGGQKQRLALARAMLRDPDVLVLDEATSALDPTSRVAVFEAVRRGRKGKTTVVITHDLAQIGREDFVYVLKDGYVVESGRRADLEAYSFGVFSSLATMTTTNLVGEFPEPDLPQPISVDTNPEPHSLTLPPLPFGHLFLSTSIPAVPSARTRVGRVAQCSSDLTSLPWHRTPNPWKPLSPPSSVFTRPPSLHFSPSDPVIKQERDTFASDIKVDVVASLSPAADAPPTLWHLIREIYPTIPNKPLVCVGLIVCLCSGATTPVFSFLLSRLLFEVSVGAQDTHAINKFGAIVLGVAAADGLLIGLKYFLMQGAAMAWVTRLRRAAFARVLLQDKRWFDEREGSGALGRVLITDGDDARELLAGTAGQLLVVSALFGVGMVWALIAGWELALAGFAVVPVFAVVMAAQARVVARCEGRNKHAREEVARMYYETIANIRGIRCMRFENVFQVQFDKAAEKALAVARRGAFFEGCTFGVACGLIYLAEALLFYTGAVLVASGKYSYLQMVQVLNLVVFTVTIGSQLMTFTQRIAKAVQATRDLSELLHLRTRTDESDGFLRPRLDGAITFHDVGFSYPGRADAPVLQNVNLEIQAGECVAIVGTSGSGKSTIAALLQRLYEPTYGAISVGANRLRSTDVAHLRHHISVVSQQPTLFDATIAENIAYGSEPEELSDADVRCAAEAANVHDFIMSLPQGYDTPVGENATLISGGQAQRLQIARALVRPSKILILDECTSALDDANQAAILDTIKHAKVGRTTVMITHKVPVMKMCDRILVVRGGRIAEEGTFEELMARAGAFAALIKGGEVL